MADKDDSGSPSDDSEAGSDASLSGNEKEVNQFTFGYIPKKTLPEPKYV